MGDFCATVLAIAEIFVRNVLQEFTTSSSERQEELIELGQQILQCFLLVDQLLPQSGSPEEVIGDLRCLIHNMLSFSEEQRIPQGRGRPRVDIGKEQLEYLIETGLKIKDVAQFFGCCTRTIE